LMLSLLQYGRQEIVMMWQWMMISTKTRQARQDDQEGHSVH